MEKVTYLNKSEGRGVFVDLCSDTGFKHALGDKTNVYAIEALKSLLNYYLPPERRIEKIDSFENTEIPGFTSDEQGRNIVIDIRCRDINGRDFIVEMQNYRSDYFFTRAVAYMASVYRENMGTGPHGYKSLKPVIMLAMLNTPLLEPELKDDHDLVSRYEFCNINRKNLVPSTISAIFVKLCEVPKELEECQGDEARCAWFVKNSRLMAEIPEGELGTGIGNILKAAEIAAFSTEKKQLYEKDIMSEKDRYAYYETAKRLGREEGLEQGLQKGLQKGLKKGLEKGLEKGRAEGRQEGHADAVANVIRTMSSKGMSPSEIADLLNLSEAEVCKTLGS